MVGQLEGLSKCHFFKLTFVTRVIEWDRQACPRLDLKTLPGNTKGGSITVPLTSCLTGLDQSVLQIKTKLSVVIQLIPNPSNRRPMVQ